MQDTMGMQDQSLKGNGLSFNLIFQDRLGRRDKHSLYFNLRFRINAAKGKNFPLFQPEIIE